MWRQKVGGETVRDMRGRGRKWGRKSEVEGLGGTGKRGEEGD